MWCTKRTTFAQVSAVKSTTIAAPRPMCPNPATTGTPSHTGAHRVPCQVPVVTSSGNAPQWVAWPQRVACATLSGLLLRTYPSGIRQPNSPGCPSHADDPTRAPASMPRRSQCWVDAEPRARACPPPAANSNKKGEMQCLAQFCPEFSQKVVFGSTKHTSPPQRTQTM